MLAAVRLQLSWAAMTSSRDGLNRAGIVIQPARQSLSHDYFL